MLTPRHRRTESEPRRLDRLENVVLALVGKVKKMAAGQEHYEASFGRLQDSITALGRDLGAKLSDLVAAHDRADDENFEAHAGQLDELVNQVQNLGKADNQATSAGQSPSGTAGPSSGDLPQGRGPLAPPAADQKADRPAAQPAAGGSQSQLDAGGEHDVVVKGRDMPD